MRLHPCLPAQCRTRFCLGQAVLELYRQQMLLKVEWGH